MAPRDTNELTWLVPKVLYSEGGEYSEKYPLSNAFVPDDSVYCALNNTCTLLLDLTGDSKCPSVKEIFITAPPRSGFTNPVQFVAAFLAMDATDLVDRCAEFLQNSSIGHLFIPGVSQMTDRQSLQIGPGTGITPHGEQSSPLSPSPQEWFCDDICEVTYSPLIPGYETEGVDGRRRLREDRCVHSSTRASTPKPTVLSADRFKSSGPLAPVAVGAIPGVDKGRQLRIRFEAPISARYIVLWLSNKYGSRGNVDIESILIKGSSLDQPHPSVELR
uniref:ARAD1B17424p n=1 Tax=Blastobotrys adeninivorans TaxID=409370 RepID=A0A060T766_BLAAD